MHALLKVFETEVLQRYDIRLLALLTAHRQSPISEERAKVR